MTTENTVDEFNVDLTFHIVRAGQVIHDFGDERHYVFKKKFTIENVGKVILKVERDVVDDSQVNISLSYVGDQFDVSSLTKIDICTFHDLKNVREMRKIAMEVEKFRALMAFEDRTWAGDEDSFL